MPLLLALDASAYETAFAKTPVDEIEVRTLPPARLISVATQGSYFDRADDLFKRLFNYISNNDISMTVPVEGQLDRAQMRFYLGQDAPDTPRDGEGVEVIEVPSRMVASIGGSGSYSAPNVGAARQRLESWLADQEQWAIDGEPYAVFWNGPFTLWFMKRFEVHVPIKPSGPR